MRKNHCPSPDDARARAFYERGELPPAGAVLTPLCQPWARGYRCSAWNVTCETCKKMLHERAQLLNLILRAGGAVENFKQSVREHPAPDRRQRNLF